jgi:hypothetical protein
MRQAYYFSQNLETSVEAKYLGNWLLNIAGRQLEPLNVGNTQRLSIERGGVTVRARFPGQAQESLQKVRSFGFREV